MKFLPLIPIAIFLLVVIVWKKELTSYRLRAEKNPKWLSDQKLMFQSVFLPAFGVFSIMNSGGKDPAIGILFIGLGLASFGYLMFKKLTKYKCESSDRSNETP